MTEPAPTPPADAEAASALLDVLYGAFYASALRTVAVHRVADQLTAGPLTPDVLAERAGVDGSALRRVLRLLASLGVFREDEEGAFHLTRMAELLRVEANGSLRDLVLLLTDELFWQALPHLDDVVRTGEPGFDAAFGTSFFAYLREHPDRQTLFSTGLSALSAVNDSAIVARLDLPDTGTVVDVGAGPGSLLRSVLMAKPALDGVLFDQDVVVREHVLDVPELAGRWRVEAGDFFVAVPPGGDVYLLKQILHDWNDDDCLRILDACRRAMTPGDRLVVMDTVISPGNDPHHGKTVDVMMMTMLNGRERSADEFTALLAKAGFTVTGIRPTPFMLSVVDAVA